MRIALAAVGCAVLGICARASAQTISQRPQYSVVGEIAAPDSVIFGTARIVLVRSAWRGPGELGLATLVSMSGRPELGRMEVEDLRLDGVSPVIRRDSAGLHLVVPATPARAPVVLTFRFRTPAKSSVLSNGFVLFDGESATWYPRLMADDAEARVYTDFDVRLVHADSVAVLASGRRTEVGSARSGVREVRHMADDIEATLLAYAPRFVVRTVERGAVQVNSFDRADPDSALGDVLTPTADAIEWYERNIAPFPQRYLGVIPGSTRNGGGSPFPGVFQIHRMYTTPAFLEAMTAHEVGHYYWGYSVLGQNGKPGSLSWLMLGNSIWADQLHLARKRGIEFDAQWHTPDVFNMPERYLTAQLSAEEQRLGLVGAALDSAGGAYGGDIAHGKAAIGVMLIARRLGIEQFVQLQSRIIQTFRHKWLSDDQYGALLEEAGIVGARNWISLWKRGDARLSYQVSSIRPVGPSTDRRWRVRIARNGTISVPVDVLLRWGSAGLKRQTLQGTPLDSIDVVTDGPAPEVLLDPDGVLPMPTSAGLRVRSAVARAMLGAGLGDNAILAAHEHLRRVPYDTLVRSALVVRLADVGAFADVRSLMFAPEAFRECTSRATCLGLIALARARAMTGDRDGARALLDAMRSSSVRGGAGDAWLAASRLVP